MHRRCQAKGVTVYLLGGMVKPATEAVIGLQAAESLARDTISQKGFFGTNGADRELGFTTPDPGRGYDQGNGDEKMQKMLRPGRFKPKSVRLRR